MFSLKRSITSLAFTKFGFPFLKGPFIILTGLCFNTEFPAVDYLNPFANKSVHFVRFSFLTFWGSDLGSELSYNLYSIIPYFGFLWVQSGLLGL
jgi:hypothetical protein